MESLEAKLQYTFKNKALLDNALSHSSYANENRGKFSSNERLEFLGDSVLGFVVARGLYLKHPELPEGQMTRLRSELVCEQSLFETAKRLELGSFIRLGRGEESSGGRERESILADCVEAIIAALFLDGGVDTASRFIESFVLDGKEPGEAVVNTDFKTALQELIQCSPGNVLAYDTASESGPDHNKVFCMRVSLNGEALSEGSGKTKKEAEQRAAQSALETLNARGFA
ncbi:MAG: ribonuclease III [Oscillospiraceae bacterium]|jgi:ribonuclease-3|nr:ribonuclease III [Oscillospiraceae bacterium]